jgi:AraC-like DNA-binding protein
MNPFEWYQGKTGDLSEFPFILEFVHQKIQQIELNSMVIDAKKGIRIYFINEGRFDWVIDNKPFLLYPNDAAIACPWQKLGSEKGYLAIGTITCLTILPQWLSENNELTLGEWSQIPDNEQRIMARILCLQNKPVLPRLKLIQPILENLYLEISQQQLGYKTRVRQLIDELLLTIFRAMSKQENDPRDFPQTFLKLEQALRENLEYQWTVEEMAGLMGLGTTAFSEKVKHFSGFSPLNYLINIRISEAIRLLKSTTISLTDIALQTGFYSSQHFSSTFKKLTGYTPRDFRKNSQS